MSVVGEENMRGMGEENMKGVGEENMRVWERKT